MQEGTDKAEAEAEAEAEVNRLTKGEVDKDETVGSSHVNPKY